MSSKKEEERNEKIIRGLMKLPPNRRCINCNALGPQYVCTTFWTFVCMTCSGIHREFTHRVKSVSMSKFTSQEVEALQKGGNQRAREIYLNGWDLNGQRLPNNSNPEKVRAFMKNVYVDKKYVGSRSSDKPPRDSQNQIRHEEETRRASSYHSYSQSPPYDFQYEERRYGKQALALTRKLGSDRGLYEGKFSSFFSPSRLIDHSYEDRFSNEGSNPRISDYSVSSRGDPLRSDAQSPNFQKEIGSPFNETSRDISAEDIQHYTGKDGVKVSCPQRTMSSGSFGSFDSNSMSFKSINSTGLAEVASEAEQSLETHKKELTTSSSLPRPSVSGSSDALDIFSAPFEPQDVTSVASASNASQFPESSSTPSLDLLQPSPSLTTPTFSVHLPVQGPTTASSDLFSGMPQQFPSATINKTSAETITPQNEGWATFDSQIVKPTGIENVTVLSPHGNSVGNVNPPSLAPWSSFENSAGPRPPSSSPALWQEGPQNNLSGLNAASTHWSSFQDFSANTPSLAPIVWNESQQITEATMSRIGTQSWNVFEDSTRNVPTQSTQTIREQVEMQQPEMQHPSVVDRHLDFGVSEGSSSHGFQRAATDPGHSFSGIPSQISMPLDDFSKHEAGHPYETGHKSTNPFDLPYENDTKSNNMFWDMSSVQAALPNGEITVPFAGGVSQPWFSPSPVTPYVPTGPQDTLGLMARQAPSSQISNMQTQGPVASIGGNPFA